MIIISAMWRWGWGGVNAEFLLSIRFFHPYSMPWWFAFHLIKQGSWTRWTDFCCVCILQTFRQPVLFFGSQDKLRRMRITPFFGYLNFLDIFSWVWNLKFPPILGGQMTWWHQQKSAAVWYFQTPWNLRKWSNLTTQSAYFWSFTKSTVNQVVNRQDPPKSPSIILEYLEYGIGPSSEEYDFKIEI